MCILIYSNLIRTRIPYVEHNLHFNRHPKDYTGNNVTPLRKIRIKFRSKKEISIHLLCKTDEEFY